MQRQSVDVALRQFVHVNIIHQCFIASQGKGSVSDEFGAGES
jgi:hypothetical protein